MENNQLTSLAGLRTCAQLEELKLYRNQIAAVDEVGR